MERLMELSDFLPLINQGVSVGCHNEIPPLQMHMASLPIRLTQKGNGRQPRALPQRAQGNPDRAKKGKDGRRLSIFNSKEVLMEKPKKQNLCMFCNKPLSRNDIRLGRQAHEKCWKERFKIWDENIKEWKKLRESG